MDCNNYSYANGRNDSNIIAAFDGYDSYITFTLEQNYFQEMYYYVSDALGDVNEWFTFSRWNEVEKKEAYAAAAAFYNSIVPDYEAIPLF